MTGMPAPLDVPEPGGATAAGGLARGLPDAEMLGTRRVGLVEDPVETDFWAVCAPFPPIERGDLVVPARRDRACVMIAAARCVRTIGRDWAIRDAEGRETPAASARLTAAACAARSMR
ncbi:MAG: hypothetical protein JWO74_2266 [Solirubrobacterales bacterium]|nr:hypothetical protein [Solirubrobacterales bacterium]